jgi:betaine-aldehyde dehydrogenase
VNALTASFDALNPATGAVIGQVADHDARHIEEVVATAQGAQRAWQSQPLQERIRLLEAGARLVEENAEALALADAEGTGNPLHATRRDVAIGVAGLRHACVLAHQVGGRTIPMGHEVLDYTIRQPYGVVARIIPFNHPVQFAVQKVAAPLVMGNAVVLKPSPFGAVAARDAAQLLASVLPAGVLQVVTDSSGAAGSALVQHPAVKRIAFTGSPAVAQRIMNEATGIKAFSFELGGKNPIIVLPDVDITAAAEAAFAGMNLDRTLGQSCGSTSRVFAHDDVYDEMVSRLTSKFEAIELGLPADPATKYGCLVSAAQLAKVEYYVALGLQEGARLVVGGARPDAPELAGGHFYRPTLFVDVDPAMRIANEEVFGPVLCVHRWRDEEQLIHDVNLVDVGLTANIWTNDLSSAHRLAAAVEAGYVWINGPDGRHHLGAPFGGFKASGIGREASIEELESYTETKNVAVYLNRRQLV